LDGASTPTRVLDLGCGIGRHLVFLGDQGYEAFGMDISVNGLLHSRDWLQKKGQVVRLTRADMTALPFSASSFNFIVSTYVIHHNTLAGIRSTIREIHRLLIPGGQVLLIIPSTRGERFGNGVEIEPGTIIPDIGQDCGIPHHYSDLAEIAREFADFIIREIKLDEKVNDDGYLSSHWFMRMEKPRKNLQ
jgi:ubiquinone/menaquinone biosynthesis C-methylase UbiE